MGVRHPKIKDLPRVEKPREKLIEKGAEALKDSELLAILLGSGYRGRNVLQLANKVLTEYPLKNLKDMDLENLRKLKGIGWAKGCLIKAAFELSKRALLVDQDFLPTVKKPIDDANQVAEIRKLKKENLFSLQVPADVEKQLYVDALMVSFLISMEERSKEI